ncbi:hypothetical protein BCR44DRAFT_1430586, partial [Catenaria anguillulae PL171]
RLSTLDGNQLQTCEPPPSGRFPPPFPAAERTCARCPTSLTARRVPVTPVTERSHFYLHGCLSVGENKACTWLDLPGGIPCLAKEVVTNGFVCNVAGQSMDGIDDLYSIVMAMGGNKDGGIAKDSPRKPVSGGGSTPVDISPSAAVGGGDGSRRWVFIAVPLLAFVGGLALGAALLIYRRRRRAERDRNFSQAVAYTPAPLPTHYNASQASPTLALSPIPLPTYSSPPVPSAPAPPTDADKPIPATPASLPRPMDTTGLSLIPLPLATDSTSAPESLQSLTDAWESLFIRIEHECTQAARAAVSAASSIPVVRAERKQRMITTMAQVWPALSTGASATGGQDDGLVERMREVMARMSAAYPTFELMGVAAAGVDVRTDAMVEYAASLPGVGVETRRVVKGMVWPGWFDGARQVVVVKARVVVE